MQYCNITGSAALTLEPTVKPKRIHSIEGWTSAFQIFVAIYTKPHPSEAPALMKYGDTIRDLALRGFNWRFYDENFQFIRERDPVRLPWDLVHTELWIRSQPLTKNHGGPLGIAFLGLWVQNLDYIFLGFIVLRDDVTKYQASSKNLDNSYLRDLVHICRFGRPIDAINRGVFYSFRFFIFFEKFEENNFKHFKPNF